MKVNSTQVAKIKVKGDDISTLKSALKKILQYTVGFNANSLSDSEHKVIKELSEKL
jgi:hypothetical protein